MAFRPQTLDHEKSPYTGLVRESWIEAGKYLLDGIFQNIAHFEDPIVLPRKETEITYPHQNVSPERLETEKKAEMFEGLARSFFIAAPLIHDDPGLTVCGYSMKEYYKSQVLRTCTPGDPVSAGTYGQLQALNGSQPFRTYQQTVETCALVICLWICRDEIWDTYTKEEKDVIAAFLTGFAHGCTVPQNWRLFNMLDMAFLHMEGYPIEEDIMLDHAQAVLNFYVGDGWYRDGHSFDYYSCWAFNVYAPIWNKWYGYENAPDIAAKFEEHSNKLMETYGDFFDRDGFTNMWGRSNIYRNASTSAFDGNLFLKHPAVDPGLARRISSGALMQFLSRDDVLYKGAFTLGFYGQFSPLVQGYSCAESPFWMGKAFLCLHLPADHPFWTARENNGTWEKLKPGEVKDTALNGPALCFTNHEANGETILRTGKVVKAPGDIHGMWNYGKLSFNTKYPWESTPVPQKGEPMDVGGVEAQQYVLKDVTTDTIQNPNVIFWSCQKDGVLYRREYFNFSLDMEEQWIQAINLADFPVSCGIMRVDRHKLFMRPVTLTLGSYGFPDNGTQIIRKSEGAKPDTARAIILKGKDSQGKDRQMAMTIYDGWEELDLITSKGTNPDSERSIILYASASFRKQYGGYEPYVMISQVITKESAEDFTDEELFPIRSISYEDGKKTGAYGTVTIELKDGTCRKVNYDGIEGHMTL
ncbi:MAG TPA: DUF2264 domain-containing protein [Candidatus Eisenbergiella merdipullorum]|uniref:DUF2264 domain-containing protein n=1 Tax=Candidatus Eisenbergiella merdipullorum TaxID=2838553 RepID=A0A9D2I6K4_9FIRM|nr:DUF2264 domain-containing protein [Candidatus Eisenbergiella merdipullorum]